MSADRVREALRGLLDTIDHWQENGNLVDVSVDLAANVIDARAALAASNAPAPNCEREDCRALRDLLNRPEIDNFIEGVRIEAAHQIKRWGSEQDRRKEPEEWYWVVGYLAGKALRAQRDGDYGKFMHHLISSAAVLANWHYFTSYPQPAEQDAPSSEQLNLNVPIRYCSVHNAPFGEGFGQCSPRHIGQGCKLQPPAAVAEGPRNDKT